MKNLLRRFSCKILSIIVFLVICSPATSRAGGQVVAWGVSAFNLTNVPPDLTNALAVATGDSYNLVLKAGGTVTSWGDNNFGQTNVPVVS